MKTIKYAIRFLVRSKSYTLINLLGLAFSLACCIILMRYIHREWTVESHCIRPDEVITILNKDYEYQYPISQQEMLSFHPDLKEIAIPEEQIIESCQFVVATDIDFQIEKVAYNLDLLAVDSTYFHFFDYPLVEGELCLNHPQDAILTKACAQRLFGKESAVGKVLYAFGKDITVRGVIDQPACKSILNFELLVTQQLIEWSSIKGGWLRILPGEVDLEKVNAKTNVFGSVKSNDVYENSDIRHEYIPWKDIYYKQWIAKEETVKLGNRTYERMLIGVVIILLLVGMINFINLYMIYTMKRQKEYGIKKVFGLQGFHFFFQIWLENVMLSLCALLIAWLLVEITIPFCERLMDEPMTGYNLFDLQLSIAFLLVFPIITSLYPFIKHNYFRPITSIRSVTGSKENIVVRMSFLFLQYTITLTLLIVAMYFNRQLHFQQNTPMGFQSEGILYAELVNQSQFDYSDGNLKEFMEAWKAKNSFYEQKLNECPFIDKWVPIRSGNILNKDMQNEIINDKNEAHNLIIQFVESGFFEIHNVKVTNGVMPQPEENGFTPEVVLNESAMKQLGYKDIQEAFIRSKDPLWVSYNPKTQELVKGGVEPMPVKAVVSDFYAGHVSEGIKPMMLLVDNDQMRGHVIISSHEGKEKETIEYLKAMVKEMTGSEDFVYSWLQDEVNTLYDDDRRLASIYNIFAFTGILIICLGLFGISLFDFRQRYREIAIRKVNGAGLKDLYRLLFKKYLLVLVASFVVATPLAYYLIHRYTADFAVKAPIGIGIFAWALLLIVTISVGTLWWQIRKASNIDPAVVMKTE